MDESKIFWHKPHFEALKYELHQYRNALKFIIEHQLSKEALIMDVLIIKKDPATVITKNIGVIFKTHNIVEYKSVKDSLSIFDYQKVLAYALLYSSFERIPISEITVTFSITVRPKELYKYLKNERKLLLHEASDGITYIKGEILPVQVLESKELPEEDNMFLRSLRRGNSTDRIFKIVKTIDGLTGLDPKNPYIVALYLTSKETFKEAFLMSEELRQLWNEIADETGWLADREAELVAVTARETARVTARESARETARRLLAYDFPVDKIAAATNLAVEEVLELA